MSFLMVRASSAAATKAITAGMTAASGVALPLLAMLVLMLRRGASLHVRARAIAPELSAHEGGGKAANIPVITLYF